MSDQKVVGLNGEPVEPVTEYNIDVTTLIEQALADAKKYKASSVCIALVTHPKKDDPAHYDIDLYWHGKRLTLLAGAARLTHRLNEKCDEAMEVIS
jgi:hypothetical protein